MTDLFAAVMGALGRARELRQSDFTLCPDPLPEGDTVTDTTTVTEAEAEADIEWAEAAKYAARLKYAVTRCTQIADGFREVAAALDEAKEMMISLGRPMVEHPDDAEPYRPREFRHAFNHLENLPAIGETVIQLYGAAGAWDAEAVRLMEQEG